MAASIIEKLAIPILEPIIGLRIRLRRKKTTHREGLRLGRARAAFGRKGSDDVYLAQKDRLKHVLKIGSSGSGKTVSTLGDAICDLMSDQPFLLLDCHDAIEKLLPLIARAVVSGRLSEEKIRDIYVMAPADSRWVVHFNPLQCSDPVTAHLKVGPVIELLRVFWGDILGPQTYEFTQCTLTLLAERKIPLTEVIALLTDRVRLHAEARQLLNPLARDYFLRCFLAWSPQRQTQVMQAFTNKITVFLADPRLAAMLSAAEGDIDFRRAMDEGKTILIDLNKGQFFDTVALLASLMLVSLQQATFSRTDLPEHERRSYIIQIDEFTTFAVSKSLEIFLNESRKFGVGLVLIGQTFASMNNAMLSALRSNSQTQLYFRLSPEDARIATSGLTGEVRELISRQLVSLPTGEAILFQGGADLRRLHIDNVEIPKRLSAAELAIIERIRRNVGQPLDFRAPLTEAQRAIPTTDDSIAQSRNRGPIRHSGAATTASEPQLPTIPAQSEMNLTEGDD